MGEGGTGRVVSTDIGYQWLLVYIISIYNYIYISLNTVCKLDHACNKLTRAGSLRFRNFTWSVKLYIRLHVCLSNIEYVNLSNLSV